jgi:hypothetical protein
MNAAHQVRACAHSVFAQPRALGSHPRSRLSKAEKAWAQLARTPIRPVRFVEVAKTGAPMPRPGNLAQGNADVTSEQ